MALQPATPLHAQQISGTLQRSIDSLPVAGALVILSNSAGHDVARTISSERGRFLLDAPTGGAYRLRVLRIGMRPFGPHAVSVPASGRVPVELFVRDLPVELAAVTVAGRTACGIPPDNSILGTLLTEARKALALTEATLEERRFLFVIETWQRRQARDLTTIDSVPTVSVDRGWPIRSAPSESLRVWGFVKGARDSLDRETSIDYYGPDAHVLFDDWFLTSHCLRVAHGPLPGQIALAFRPERLHDNVDISGRFVFDSSSLALRELSWRWEGLPHWVPDDGQGGFVRFEAMPSGGWLPTAWSLRAPIEAVDRYFGSMLGEFAEFGGRVAARSDRADSAAALATALHTATATISGMVTDTSGRPIGDARVSVRPSGNSVLTDSAGKFRLDALRPGTSILHAQTVGYAPADFAVRVPPDSTFRVTIQLTARPITLDTVTVTTTPENVVGLQSVGFYERRRERQRGAGTSSFVTPEEIERRRPQHVTDLLAQLPGVHVLNERTRFETGVLVAYGRRFGCAMAVWVDGALVKTPTPQRLGSLPGGISKDVPGGIDGYVSVNQVSAIEVYQTAAEVPAQFNIVDNECGTIVIWTGSRR
ncbi:MAG: carboxypeptidase regulatory-like domain-containing protein [Gemmatimonadales bacterium]